MRCISRKDMSN